MPRLRNTRTGSVVSVDDATAARLGPDYQPIEVKAEAAPKRSRRKPAKADDE